MSVVVPVLGSPNSLDCVVWSRRKHITRYDMTAFNGENSRNHPEQRGITFHIDFTRLGFR